MVEDVGAILRKTALFVGQGYATWAWGVLPVPAVLELAGITAFAMSIFGTFILGASHVQNQPLVVGIDTTPS